MKHATVSGVPSCHSRFLTPLLENGVSAGEYMTFDSKPTSRKSKDHMVKAVAPASADVASEKTRVPIYFSKKMSKLAQVRPAFPSPAILPNAPTVSWLFSSDPLSVNPCFLKI